MTNQYFNDPIVNFFGIEIKQAQYQRIKLKLDLLKEKCPANSKITLNFKQKDSGYIGYLTVKSYTETFESQKISHNPYQTFLLLEEDIDQQLLEWKRVRFSKNLAQSLHRPNRVAQSA